MDEPEVRIAWWIYPYMYGCAFVAWLMRVEPDVDKFRKTIRKGLSIKHKQDGKWAIFRRS
jgi:hypothetical protein